MRKDLTWSMGIWGMGWGDGDVPDEEARINGFGEYGG
jgi:hypothetical protein